MAPQVRVFLTSFILGSIVGGVLVALLPFVWNYVVAPFEKKPEEVAILPISAKRGVIMEIDRRAKTIVLEFVQLYDKPEVKKMVVHITPETEFFRGTVYQEGNVFYYQDETRSSFESVRVGDRAVVATRISAARENRIEAVSITYGFPLPSI